MKLTKTRYKKLKTLMAIARKPTRDSNYKFMSTILYIIENWYKRSEVQKNMRIGTQFILNCSKYGLIAKILKTVRKQKLLNKKDCIIL